MTATHVNGSCCPLKPHLQVWTAAASATARRPHVASRLRRCHERPPQTRLWQQQQRRQRRVMVCHWLHHRLPTSRSAHSPLPSQTMQDPLLARVQAACVTCRAAACIHMLAAQQCSSRHLCTATRPPAAAFRAKHPMGHHRCSRAAAGQEQLPQRQSSWQSSQARSRHLLWIRTGSRTALPTPAT